MTSQAPIYRAAMDLEVEGRTLLGLAVPYDRPALVSDWGGPRYWEAFAPSVFVRSLEQQPWPRPLYLHHEWRNQPNAEPMGVADFAQSAEGLVFRAHISKTRKGDWAIERHKAGLPSGVSVGAEPLAHEMRSLSPAPTDVLVRTEAKLLELSFSRTGVGQYPEAKVLAMRAAPDGASFSDIEEEVADALTAAHFPSSPDEGPADAWVCIFDQSDEWVIYTLEGNVDEELEGLWRRSYDMAADGTVTLGAAEPVAVSYVGRAEPEPLGLIIPEWLAQAQDYRKRRRY